MASFLTTASAAGLVLLHVVGLVTIVPIHIQPAMIPQSTFSLGRFAFHLRGLHFHSRVCFAHVCVSLL